MLRRRARVVSALGMGLALVVLPSRARGDSPAATTATATAAHVEIRTSDGKGIVIVDGQPSKDEGAFVGDVPAGVHTIEVRREGFESVVKPLTLAAGQTYAETVTLVRPADVVTEPASALDRPIEGTYGGFGVVGLAQIGGMGSELETGCGTLGAASCDTPSPLGAGLFGFFGYTWNPVGFELMIGGLADTATQKAHFDGNTSNGQNPLLATPAREEQLSFYRFGPIAAIRVRATVQNRIVRGTFAAGIGLAYRQMYMQRKAQSNDGALSDTYSPDSVSYVSPAISLDAAVHLRIARSTALSLGLMLWAENAGSSAATPPDPNRNLVGPAGAVPIATPQYHLATGSQIFLGPYLGMMFGP